MPPKATEKEEVKAATFIDPAVFAEHAGAGLEDATAKHMQLPFFAILQTNSPQVVEGNAKRIEDAIAGQVLDTVSLKALEARESKKSALHIIPVHFRELFCEWVPREKGGGFVQHHEDESILAKCHKGEGKEAKKDFLDNGNEIKRTHYWAVVADIAGNKIPGVIAMASSQLKVSRKWLTNINNTKMKRADGSLFTPPMCSKIWALSTVPEQKNQDVFFNWKVTEVGLVASMDDFNNAIEYKKLASQASVAALPAGPEHGALEDGGEESPV